MVRSRIVKINRRFYQPLPQNAVIEVNILLWIFGKGRDVVNPLYRLHFLCS